MQPVAMTQQPLAATDLPRTGSLDWALCLATLNRMDTLITCLRCAIAQTRPPVEVIVVDASDNWQDHASTVAEMFDGTDIRLHYVPARLRSSASQRNQALLLARADICFLIDDDSFMHSDCADHVLRVYEHPDSAEIVAVSASDGPSPVAADQISARKNGLTRSDAGKVKQRSAVARFVWRHVFLMSSEEMFIPYMGHYQKRLPDNIRRAGLDVTSTSLIGGYRLTVRREVAARLLFNRHLHSYSPGEDLDLTHRMSQIGYLAIARHARLYHHEVASSRIKRKTATQLSMTNLAFFIRQNAVQPTKSMAQYAILVLRRILAETIKDAGSRRWDFVQLRGVLAAIPTAVQIMTRDKTTLAEWYSDKQLQILAAGRREKSIVRP